MIKKLIIIVGLIILLLFGCENDVDIMKNRIEGEPSSFTENDIVVTESDKVITEIEFKIPKYDKELYHLSGYKNTIYGYSGKDNEIVSFDEAGKLIKTFRLKEDYSILNLEQIGDDEFLIAYLEKVDEELFANIIYVKDETEEVLFDHDKNKGESIGLHLNRMLKLGDVVFILDFENTLFRLENGQATVFEMDEQVIDICKTSNRLYVLKEDSIDVFDAETEQLMKRLNLNGIKCIGLYGEDTISLVSKSQLYVSSDFTSFEKISVQNPGSFQKMSKYSGLGGGKILSNDFDSISAYSIMDKTQISDCDDVITVGFFDTSERGTYNTHLKQLDFSDVKIELKNYYNSSEVMSTEQFMTKMTSEFLTGNAPDVMLLSSDICVKDLVLSGNLLDLTQLFETDSDFDIGVYEENFVDALKIEDKLFFHVLSPSPSYIEYNTELLNKLGYEVSAEMDMNDLYDIYTSVNEDLKNPDYHIGYHIEGDDTFFTSRYYRMFSDDVNQFFDYESGRVRFDSDEFIELLEKMKVIYNGYLNSSFTLDELYVEFNRKTDNPKLDNHLFYIMDHQSGYIRGELYDKGTEILPIPNGFVTGKRALFSNGSYVMINKNSEKLDAAWRAYKTLVSYESEYYLSVPAMSRDRMGYTNLSLHKEANKKKIETMKEDQQSDYYKSRGYRVTTDEEIQKIDDMLRVDYSIVLKSSFDECIVNDLQRFVDGEITADEVAKILQNKAELYLGE